MNEENEPLTENVNKEPMICGFRQKGCINKAKCDDCMKMAYAGDPYPLWEPSHKESEDPINMCYLEEYKQAISDYEKGHISLEECTGFIHYRAGHHGTMTYEKYISLR